MTIIKRKLELTWVGKDERPRLEPRILVEDRKLACGDPDAENMLIQGDNLLALRALEQDFAGKVKCIYIDPPFNTGQAFEHYEDGLEHSIWLSMMRDRLEILHRLLHATGTCFIHIDDNELGYLIALADEIFGRQNRAYIVTFKQSSASGPKAVNPGLVTTSNFVLIYAKDKSQWHSKKTYMATERDDRYSKCIENYEQGWEQWKLVSLREYFAREKGISVKELREYYKDELETELERFVLQNAQRVVRTARVAPKDVNAAARLALEESQKVSGRIFRSQRDEKSDYFFLNGEQLVFYSTKVQEIDGEMQTAQALTTIWDDLLSNNLHNEGGVAFPNGKKPEALLKRVVELSTNEGDWILDSFAGSGTTSAVSHKLARRWVAIEFGEHAVTHCLPRLRSVVSGTDQSGISKAIGWKGGGGFKFYRLAETLLVKDRDLSTKKKSVYVINPKYDPVMLTRAICKIENYRFRQNHHWHGISSEHHFLYVTTKLLDQKHLDALSKELSEDAALLVYCTRKTSRLKVPDNIEIKKIPRDLLAKCAFEEGRV